MKLNKHYISRLLCELLKLPRVGGRGNFSDVGRVLNASTPRETNFRWPDFVFTKREYKVAMRTRPSVVWMCITSYNEADT